MSAQETIRLKALAWHREQRNLKAAALQLMQTDKCGTFSITKEGRVDTTQKSIEAAQREIDGHDNLIAAFEKDMRSSN